MFPHSQTPLLYAKPPHKDESLIGYIIRLTELHKLKSPSPILRLIHGKRYKIPSQKDITKFASIVGCNPNVIANLFGFGSRNSEYQRVWRLGNEWITKPYFISSRTLSFCPICLREKPYLRSVWELVFYQACSIHNVQLIHVCSYCNKPPQWTRSSVTKCTCGAPFTEEHCRPAENHSLLISTLIHNRISDKSLTNEGMASNNAINKLAHLTIDGLFKTIWLLGEILENNVYAASNGELPKKKLNATLVMEKFFKTLVDWPDRFFYKLNKFSRQSVTNKSNSYINRTFGPVHRYFTEEMDSKEFVFLTSAYEHHIKRIWMSANKPAPRSISNQLDLPIEDLL